jgi:transcriptional regulator with XRE-family HTH domain
LQIKHLGDTLLSDMSESVSARTRLRLRHELARRELSQNDIAGRLEWSPSRISKVLNGKIGMDLDDLAAICFAMGFSLVEAVRDHGLEFLAEMTPSEMRFLERIRQLDKPDQDSWMQILDIKRRTQLQERRATSYKSKRRG